MKPPIPFSLALITSTFQRFASANFEYILKRSAAKSAASSPPAPPRISTITFFSSLGSFGSMRILSSCSHFSTVSLHSLSSSFASSRISSSLSSSSIARLSSIPSFAALYSLYFSTIGVSSFCSRISSLYFFWSLITSGSVSIIFISSKRPTSSSNLSNIVFPPYKNIVYIYIQCINPKNL